MRRSLCSLVLILFAVTALAVPTDSEAKAQYQKILAGLSLDNLKSSLKSLSGERTRLAGSDGEKRTQSFVANQLRSLGATNIRRETFKVTIPDPDSTGTLSLKGHAVEVWPLWPNLARTSTCDVSGPIIYGGKGTLEALSGKSIRGSIVVLEFNTGIRWKNAAKLGAKAVVFIEPSSMPRAEAEQKFSGVPLDLPRFYLPLKSAGPVLNAAFNNEIVTLRCRQDWVVRESSNLLADFPGSDRRANQQDIALLAYSDSMSIVPGLNPGAESATGVAALLETARRFTEIKHRRPLTVGLLGAHSLGLRGVREFVQKRLDAGKGSPFLTITLDLATGSPTVGSYARGWFEEYRNEPNDSMRSMSRVLRAHVDNLAKVMNVSPARLLFTDAVNQGDNRTWKNNIPGRFALDCEPIVCSGMNGLTWATIEDSRDRTDTPFDTFDKVQVTNLFRQTQTITCLLDHVLNDTSNKGEPSDYKVPLDPNEPQDMTLIGGFSTVVGEVVLYDPQKSFVPDVKIPNSIAAILGSQRTMMGVRGDMIQATEGPDAKYEFHGLPPINAYGVDQQRDTRIAAFHLDPKTGVIDYAPTWNVPGFGAYSFEFKLTVGRRESPVVVFQCVPISLYDLVDPQDLKALNQMRVFDAKTGSLPRDFGIFTPPQDQRLNPEVEDIQILFTIPGQAYQILAGSRTELNRLILTNTSPGQEQGTGYIAPGGKAEDERGGVDLDGRFANVPLNSAIDISNINQTRLDKFKKYRIVSAGIYDLHKQALSEIKLAQEAEKNMDWAGLDRHARAAWGYALRAYPVIQTTASDVVNGVVFYLFLILPFSYFLERLFFGNQLLTKQLTWSIGFFILAFIILRLIHPAFEIVTNPSMIFIAFVMGVLSLIVMSFILGKFEASMRAVKAQQSGVVEVDMRRSSVAMAAFNLGVSNMRRRKARTILTTLTLVVMTFIVLSFTSIVPELKLDETPSSNVPTYSGILMRNPGLDPMQLATYRQIANEFEGKGSVVRRGYYYGSDIGDIGILSLQRADRVAEVRAMLGLDPDEAKVTHPERALLPGGRWFRPGERNVMILPRPIAEQLKVDPGEVGKAKVSYAGVDYTVIGIADTSILRSIYDLDGDGFMPPDFSLSKQYQELKATSNQAFRSFIRLDPSTVFILPASTSFDLGADLRTVAVHFQEPSQTRTALEHLMPRLRLNLYASVLDKDSKDLVVRQFSVQQSSKSVGLLLIIVQMAIAAVFVLNTMVASVFERTKEIAIFSSIGLAPNHIAMLFFAESVVYGILGAVIGYLVAQATAKLIVATNTLEGLTLNFSSTSAVMSAGLVMGIVLLSTIYPAKKAAQIAAPARNDEAFETEPEGDTWNIPLPFSIGEDEAAPLTNFLSAWLRAYEGYTIGSFVTAETQRTVTGKVFAVSAVTWLAPYDLGVSQRLVLRASPSVVAGVYQLDLELTRLAGDAENWPIVNQRFLADIRKQFLTWRTLGSEERARFEDSEVPETAMT